MAESFAQLLRRFRTRRGLTKVELAAAVGAHRQSVLDWEAGKRVPRDRARLDDLTQVLNLSADEAVQLAAAARQHPHLPATPPMPPGDPTAPAAAQTFTAPQRHQLRTPLPDFVGREPAIATLLGTLRQATRGGRVAAIGAVRGMGGIGKTELAILIANRLVDVFPDAQIVVPLRGTSADPLSPVQALRQVVDAFTPGARLPDDLEAAHACYQSALHGQRVLILADDARDASQVRPLLPPAGCALLITSRVRFSLPGMATIDLEQLGEAEAITLLRSLCDRLSEADAQALAQVCGYLPLALRIVGGLLHNDPALKVASYLAHPADERQLRDPDDPQLDVEVSLRLSYAALSNSAQQVFRQLGVLEADFAAELALAVIETEGDVDCVAILHLLLRRNLIAYDAARERWRLHDLLRALARRALEAAGEAERVMWRCARAVVAIAEETQAQYLAGGEDAVAALARFDAERLHIDMARCWADAHAGTPDGDQLLLDAALATAYIGELRYDGRREFIGQLERVLAAARRLGNRRAETCVLNSLGLAELRLGEARRSIPYCEQALALAHTIGDPRAEGHALNSLGNAYAVLGGARCALAYFEHYLTIAQALGNRRAEGIALGSLGSAYMELGEVQCAIEACIAACTILRTIGDRREEGYALSYLARAQARQGDRSGMAVAFEQALALLRTAGDGWGEAECQWQFGLARVQQGERAQALPLLRAAVAYQQEIGHARAAEHAALLGRLETEEALPAELLHPWDFSDNIEMARYRHRLAHRDTI